jgi:hypothetical protein
MTIHKLAIQVAELRAKLQRGGLNLPRRVLPISRDGGTQ